MTRILDTYAVIAFFQREEGYEKVKSYLFTAADKGNHLLMSSVSFGEVHYISIRRYGEEKAHEIEIALQGMFVEIVPVDAALAREAARFKATKKMSYADCFAAALAKLRKGEVITGDKEFKEVEKEVKIAWIGGL